MQQRPDPPAAGRLIADATDRLGISIREAARRADLSYGRWRQITSGYQNVSPGEYAKVHAPAKTLAKMAAVVGVTPEQMETAGQRPDAADAMRREHPARTRVTRALSGGPDLQPYLDIIDMERAAGIPPRSEHEHAIWESTRLSDTEKRGVVAMIRQALDDSATEGRRTTGLTPVPSHGSR